MATKEKREEIFSSYPIPRAVAALAVPSVLSSLVNVIYNMADTYFVSLMKDTNATAAVSITMPVFLFFVAFGNIFGVGGSAYISRSMGEGNHYKVKKISSFAIFSSIFSGAVILALILIFINPLISALGGQSSEVIDYAYDYLKYIAIGGPAIVVSITASNLIRGEGAAKESMTGMMIGTVTNIVLDPVMILALDMGVGGAAVATVIGNVASVVYYAVYLMRGRSLLSCNPKRFSVRDGIAKNVIPVGIPAAINNVLMSVSNIILNNFMKDYGEAAVAALGVAMKVNMLVVFLQMGIGLGVQPLIGYSFGAKNIKRMKSTIRFTITCTLILGGVLTAIYYCFTDNIINIFNGENDAMVTYYGVKILRGLMLAGPFIGIMFTINFAFQGMGKSVQSLVLSLARQGIVFLPLLVIMDRFIGFDGIVYAQPVADLVCIVMAVLMFLDVTRRFKKKDRQAAAKSAGTADESAALAQSEISESGNVSE
ncbi:MAG: MATE family efflux transporter [Clostridiales bacterium]|nr:MATE family efflux transporter [Clostridiales bacterium]